MEKLAVCEGRLKEWERKIEVGELVYEKNIDIHPRVVRIMKENLDLNLMLAERQTNLPAPVQVKGNLTYAHILKKGKTIIPSRRPRLQQNFELDQASPPRGIPLKVVNVRWKIISVASSTVDVLSNRIFEENNGLVVEVKRLYEVQGRHKAYRNAEIIMSIQTAAVLEQYPFIYEGNHCF